MKAVRCLQGPSAPATFCRRGIAVSWRNRKTYLQCIADAQRERGDGLPRRPARDERSAFAGRESLPQAGAAVVNRERPFLIAPKAGRFGTLRSFPLPAEVDISYVTYVYLKGEGGAPPARVG